MAATTFALLQTNSYGLLSRQVKASVVNILKFIQAENVNIYHI